MTAALNAPLTGIRIVEFEGIGPGPLAGRMLAAAPQNGGARGEGSVLGGIGRILDGDNSF